MNVRYLLARQVRDAVIDCVSAVRRRETELLTQLRAAFAGDAAVQAFIADRPSIDSTLRGLESTCQLTDVIVRERSVELLLLKDDIADRMSSLLATSLAQPPPHMRTTHVRFIPTPDSRIPFPVGRLDLVDDSVPLSGDDRPPGDGYDSAEEDRVQEGGDVGPEVEIKRRRKDVAAPDEEVGRDLAPEMVSAEHQGTEFERIQDGGGDGSEVEIKRRHSIKAVEVGSDLAPDMTSAEQRGTTFDRGTMTNETQVMTTSTTMDHCVHVADKLVATSSPVTMDRSTATSDCIDRFRRSTETDTTSTSMPKLLSEASQTSVSVFHVRSKHVETEPLPVANKGTSTERPFQIDKVSQRHCRDSGTPVILGDAQKLA